MDQRVTISSQMDKEDNNGPVILINKFNVKHENIDSFLKAWTKDAQIMKRQSGSSLHSSIVELLVAVYSSTMRSGSLPDTISKPLTTLSSGLG